MITYKTDSTLLSSNKVVAAAIAVEAAMEEDPAVEDLEEEAQEGHHMGAGPALHLTPLCNQYLLLEISR
jgi:formaldehyde-activating enzyme involved in methanogenesis